MGALCKVGHVLEVIWIVTQGRCRYGDLMIRNGKEYKLTSRGYERTYSEWRKNGRWYGKDWATPPKISDESYQTINLRKDQNPPDKSSEFRVGPRHTKSGQNRALQGESMRKLGKRNKQIY